MAPLHTSEERNLFGYLAREFETLAERSFAEVDSLVLACLSYFRWPGEGVRGLDGVPVRELFRAEHYDAMTRDLWDPEGLVRLLAAVVASPRFRDVRICGYVDDFDESAEKQFSACALRLPSGGTYLSFRGTDNTVVGWKEDFNMAFETGVPSQVAAVDYLERMASAIEGPLYLGGHSKGGNLAVYATARCSSPTAARIVRSFSHDGPGFTEEALSEEGWLERSRLVSKTVPRSSVIGMIFERQEDYDVVASSASGLMQHDPFSWVVEGRGFAYEEAIGRGAVADPQIFSGRRTLTRLEVIKRHLAYGEEYFGERYAVTALRSFIPFYLKGIPDIKRIRNAAMLCRDRDSLLEALGEADV